jgi:hypothetical protein
VELETVFVSVLVAFIFLGQEIINSPRKAPKTLEFKRGQKRMFLLNEFGRTNPKMGIIACVFFFFFVVKPDFFRETSELLYANGVGRNAT